jgi:hypothetical protein
MNDQTFRIFHQIISPLWGRGGECLSDNPLAGATGCTCNTQLFSSMPHVCKGLGQPLKEKEIKK